MPSLKFRGLLVISLINSKNKSKTKAAKKYCVHIHDTAYARFYCILSSLLDLSKRCFKN